MSAATAEAGTVPEIRPQDGPQTVFLQCIADIAVFGGSAGGGKTFALLLDVLYDIHNPKFGAVIFRRTTKQVRSEGGPWDTATDLYTALGARPNQADLYFEFPPPGLKTALRSSASAKVTFAHMEHEKNRLDWQGSQVPYIGFDELTHFTWKQFSYLVSRNRSTSGARARIRATCNPDPDHWLRRFIDWWIGDDGFAIPERSGVIRWFIVVNDDVVWGATRHELVEQYPGSLPKSFTFIRSSVYDNKILLDADPGYLANLQAMPRVERAQLLDGNWNVRPSAGMYFRRSDFEIVDAPAVALQTVRAWDQAGTHADQEDPDDPDWTAGVRMSRGGDGYFYVEHVDRFRESPSVVDSRILKTATQDGRFASIRLAQDPGNAGKALAQSQTRMLAGYYVTSVPPTGDKETRARPLSAQVQAGNVRLVRGPWNDAFLNELEAFPEGRHDDQVDAVSDAFDHLTGRGTMVYRTPVENVLYDPSFQLPAHWPRLYAQDVDPATGRTAALWAAYDRSIDCLYVYTEHVRDRVEASVNVAAIKARGAWIPGVINPMARGRKKEDGERLVAEYRALGLLLVPVESAPEAGIQTVEERLSTGRLKISRACMNLQAEYRLYRRGEDGKIVKQYDCLMDCLRDVVLNYRGIARAQPVDDREKFAAQSRGDPTIGY